MENHTQHLQKKSYIEAVKNCRSFPQNGPPSPSKPSETQSRKLETPPNIHIKIHCGIQPESTAYSLLSPQPGITLSEQLSNNLSRLWERSIIIRLLELIRDASSLKMRLFNLWKIKGQMEIKDIGMGFHIIHGLSEDDRTRIIAARPWRLGSSLVSIRSYVPNFDVL